MILRSILVVLLASCLFELGRVISELRIGTIEGGLSSIFWVVGVGVGFCVDVDVDAESESGFGESAGT